MNSIQKNWLLETFFKNEEFAGWRGIAEKLIDTGNCVTTNQGKDIWIGGVGNFIKSEPYGGGVDLILLTFDVKEFCSVNNMFFLERYKWELNRVQEEQDKLISYGKAIISLTKF